MGSWSVAKTSADWRALRPKPLPTVQTPTRLRPNVWGTVLRVRLSRFLRFQNCVSFETC